jgi:hypothetical protein
MKKKHYRAIMRMTFPISIEMGLLLDDLKAFKKYKKAKLILEDLDAIGKVFALSIKALTFYKKYAVVSKAISALQEAKLTLDIQKKKVVNVINKKGQDDL